jgi:hypothetical protein
MKVKLTAKHIGQVIQADDVRGSIIYDGRAAEAPESKLGTNLGAELHDPDLKAAFSRIPPSEIDQKLLVQLEALHSKLDLLLKHVDPEQKAEILRLNNCLATEVRQATPDPASIKLSASGILAAARTVSGMVEPLSKTLKAIVSLVSP